MGYVLIVVLEHSKKVLSPQYTNIDVSTYGEKKFSPIMLFIST